MEGLTHMKKRIIFVISLLVLFLVGCSSKYDPEDFIGKTSEEIISQYGSFDCLSMPADEDGLYRNCSCGYTIQEADKGLFGKSEEELFFITFDENGIATMCDEGFRPGG